MNDECRERAVRALRPRNISVPSYRPRQTTGYTCNVLQSGVAACSRGNRVTPAWSRMHRYMIVEMVEAARALRVQLQSLTVQNPRRVRVGLRSRHAGWCRCAQHPGHALYRAKPGAHRKPGARAPTASDLLGSALCGSWGLAGLWTAPTGLVPPRRRVRRQDSAGYPARPTCRWSNRCSSSWSST